MGWTYWQGEHRPTDEILRDSYESVGHTVVAAGVRGGAWYAALQPAGETYVTALVVEFKRGGGQFGYRSMEETWGPFLADCPPAVFAALSPLDQLPQPGFAARWRERVRALAAVEA